MDENARVKWETRYGAEGYEPDEEPLPFLIYLQYLRLELIFQWYLT